MSETGRLTYSHNKYSNPHMAVGVVVRHNNDPLGLNYRVDWPYGSNNYRERDLDQQLPPKIPLEDYL